MDIKTITQPYDNRIGRALEKKNIPYLRMFPEKLYFQVGLGSRQRRFLYDNINDSFATQLSENKTLTKKFLTHCDVPTPAGKAISSQDELRDAFDSLSKPLVIKPIGEMWGHGITTNIKTWDEACDAYTTATSFKGNHVIIEEHVQGDDHRLLVIGGKFVAALKRMPPTITGDGASSITLLIAKENERREQSDSIAKEIEIDEGLITCLAAQSLTPESILPSDKTIRVRMTGNICSGGVSQNVTADIHPSIITTCEDISAYLNMEILGVDILTTNISEPIASSGGRFTELNQNPDITMHVAPSLGDPVDAPSIFVDYMFPSEDAAWIPITLNGVEIRRQVELNAQLESIPVSVIQKKTQFSDENITISDPNKTLLVYLLDIRTVAAEL